LVIIQFLSKKHGPYNIKNKQGTYKNYYVTT
jgi:hypothetical protein